MVAIRRLKFLEGIFGDSAADRIIVFERKEGVHEKVVAATALSARIQFRREQSFDPFEVDTRTLSVIRRDNYISADHSIVLHLADVLWDYSGIDYTPTSRMPPQSIILFKQQAGLLAGELVTKSEIFDLNESYRLPSPRVY